MIKKLRIATRESALALWQANAVKNQLLKHYPSLSIELVRITTTGDKNTNLPLHKIGGKSLFVKELQLALLENRADIAVHSIKDMSVYPYENLVLAAVCKREDPRDVFISEQYDSLHNLPPKAVVGTASPRRQSLLLQHRPDLQIKLLRGNVPSRIQKCLGGEYDAIILAAAGVKRLEATEHVKYYFPAKTFIPAIGQGAMGVECNQSHQEILNLISAINHPPSNRQVTAERAVNQILGGNCYTPIGAHAFLENNQLNLYAFVGSLNGKHYLSSNISGTLNHAQQLGEKVAEDLLAQGAKSIINADFH